MAASTQNQAPMGAPEPARGPAGRSSGTDPGGWRSQLPRLEGQGLVVLPIGAGPPDRKFPVDPANGGGLVGWPEHPGFSAAEIAAMNPRHVIGACINTGPSGLDVLDIDGPAAVAWAEDHGVDPRDPTLFRITRTTDPDRFKIPFRLTPEQRLRFPQVKNLLRVGEPDAQGKRQAIETYAKTGAQVIVLGQHCKSGGWYDWAGDPSAITAPSEAWLQVLIALAAEVNSLRGKGDTSRPPGKAGKGGGAWQASSHRHPCPVCGRDHSGACTRTAAANGRMFVSCYHGGTFSPDTTLKKGDVITGRDGNQWALVETYYADCLGEKSLFIDHQDRPQQAKPRQQSANGSGPDEPTPQEQQRRQSLLQAMEAAAAFAAADAMAVLPAIDIDAISRNACRNEALGCLSQIPPYAPGSPTTDSYTALLWGLAYHFNEELAAALMAAHSPAWAEVENLALKAAHPEGFVSRGTFRDVALEVFKVFFIDKARPSRSRGSGSAPPAATAAAGGDRDGATPDPEYSSKELPLDSRDADWLDLVIELAFGADTWLHIEDTLHRWAGTHYEPLPDKTLAPRVAPILERLYFVKKATKTTPEEIIHHWARPARVKETLDWFKKTLAPCQDFNPSNAINCRNGVLSWTWDGPAMVLSFGPHDPEQHFTYCLPYDYDAEADGTHLQTLLGALEAKDHDTMQRLLGSGLQLDRYRATKGRPRAVLLLGEGENGKDTIRGALLQTLGARGMTGCTLSDFQQYDKGRKFPLARLRGSRINWSPENTNYARLEAIQSLKGAITGDDLSFEMKNVQEEEFAPNAIFLFNCNQPPLMDGAQAAMQSRWHAVRFLKRYSADPDPTDPSQLQADPRLKDDLAFIRQNICPAMLLWLLEGLRLAVSEGINFRANPETLEAIRRQSCHLFDFAEDIGLVADPAGEVEHRQIWGLLEGWYQDHKILHLEDSGRRSWNDKDMHGDQPVRTPRELERRLKAVFPKLTSRKAPVTKVVVFVGLTL